MVPTKRPGTQNDGIGGASKRPRVDASESIVAVAVGRRPPPPPPPQPRRTSSLCAPTLRLSGHSGRVTSVSFSPDGVTLASASADKSIFLWTLGSDSVTNTGVLEGHSSGVTDVVWLCDGSAVVSASADRSVGLWDTGTGGRKCRWRHGGLVNAVAAVGATSVASASDDTTVALWDTRSRARSLSLPHSFQATAVAATGERLASGGVDGVVRLWDTKRAAAAEMTLDGHDDIITDLQFSPDGRFLASISMDSTARVWDVAPFCAGERCIMILTGASHGFERSLIRCGWSASGDRLASGSADHVAYVWDVASGRLIYRLPGHAGSCNAAVFHPKEPIIATGGSDKAIWLGEVSA